VADALTPIAHSPIKPEPPLTVIAGWQVSARQATATADLTIADCTPLAKVQVRASNHMFDVPHGSALRDEHGTLIAGSGPGEWLLLAPPGESPRLLARVEARNETSTAVDLTHGRALVRLTGDRAPDVLALLCGIDLSDRVTPDGAALRTAVAAVATDIIRDDVNGTRSYLLHCERSSGQYLFDMLLRAGEPPGIEVAGFEQLVNPQETSSTIVTEPEGVA
jgi:heterotetrameric sarcosine oxidase gamma subunit